MTPVSWTTFRHENKRYGPLARRFVYVERPDEILIDDDRLTFDFRAVRVVLRGIVPVRRVIELPSANHRHIVIQLRRALWGMTRAQETFARLALAAALGDDRVRVNYNTRRCLVGDTGSLLISPYNWRAKWRAPDYAAANTRALRNILNTLRPITGGGDV